MTPDVVAVGIIIELFGFITISIVSAVEL